MLTQFSMDVPNADTINAIDDVRNDEHTIKYDETGKEYDVTGAIYETQFINLYYNKKRSA